MRHLPGIACLLGFCLLAPGCGLLRPFVKTQPVVTLQAGDYAHPEKIVGGAAEIYQPMLETDARSDDAGLLARYAPRIVQGVPPRDSTSYDPDADRIGAPHLAPGTGPGFTVAIDTREPRLFARTEKAIVHDRELTQLVYVLWFPRRPVGAIQKGEVDGGVFRVTLDAAGRRAVYEYVQTCGCLHGVFVGEPVEAWAAEEFAAKEPGKRRFTEHAVSGKGDWVVRDVVRGADAAASPVLFVSAGGHECVAIQTTETVRDFGAAPRKTYSLRPYDELTRLPVDGKPGVTASMFNDQGLVWGGKRSGESLLLSDLDNPGWPRHLDRMKVHWDQGQWTDPHLLETFLRLPRRMIDPQAAARLLDGSAVADAPAPLPAEVATALRGDKPVAIFFTHELCGGCQEVKQAVLPQTPVREAIARWTWIEAELQGDLGKRLADYFRVDVTPTLVTLDAHGDVAQRIEGIATVDQFTGALRTAP